MTATAVGGVAAGDRIDEAAASPGGASFQGKGRTINH